MYYSLRFSLVCAWGMSAACGTSHGSPATEIDSGVDTDAALSDAGALIDAAVRVDLGVVDVDSGHVDADGGHVVMDAGLADAGSVDAGHAPFDMGASVDSGMTSDIVAGSLCYPGLEPEPCDGHGRWICDGGSFVIVGETVGEYRYEECSAAEECVTTVIGTASIARCMPSGRECNLFDEDYCGSDDLICDCNDGVRVGADVCADAYHCVTVPESGGRWECFARGLRYLLVRHLRDAFRVARRFLARAP